MDIVAVPTSTDERMPRLQGMQIRGVRDSEEKLTHYERAGGNKDGGVKANGLLRMRKEEVSGRLEPDGGREGTGLRSFEGKKREPGAVLGDGTRKQAD